MSEGQKTIAELQAESARIEALIGSTEAALGDLRARLNEIRSELAQRLRPATEPRVSDHALLRFIERTLDVDIEAIRASILTDAVKSALRAGATAITVADIKMLAKDGVLVTVLTNDMRPKRQRVKRGWRFENDIDDQLLENERL